MDPKLLNHFESGSTTLQQTVWILTKSNCWVGVLGFPQA